MGKFSFQIINCLPLESILPAGSHVSQDVEKPYFLHPE
jgi:hypothetical protein